MIIYKTSGPWGSGVGARLTGAQVDANFYDVDSRVKQLELHPPQPVQIAGFSSTGSQLYIHMSDGSVQGPVTLPDVRWFWRGQWTPSTSYSLDDTLTGPDGAVYLVVNPHISGTSFSPNANDGQGHRFYSVIFQVPASMLPEAGFRGSVLTKNSDNNYDVIWTQPGVPAGGNDGAVLMKFSAQDGDAGWTNLSLEQMGNVQIVYPFADGDYLKWNQTTFQWENAPRPMFNVLRASSWSPVVGDEGSFMVLTNGTTDVIVTIPGDNYWNLFPTGSELHIHQDGTGKVTIVPEGNVILRRPAMYSNVLLGQYATVTVKKTGPWEWRMFGLLKGA